MVELSSAVCFDKAHVSEQVLATMRKALTRSYTPYGQTESLKVKGYIETSTHMYVPRQYGIHYMNRNLSHKGLKLVDHMCRGVEMDVPCNVVARDYQVSVIDEMVYHLRRFNDLQMKAATGMGKTVMAILTAMRLGVNTLIVVDQNNLVDQWKNDNLLNPKMFDLDPDDVGQVQGTSMDFEGKAFVIATIQTITRSKRIPEEFFDHFGFVIFDEAHTTSAAESYQSALFDINAQYRLTVTATPRDDVYGYMQSKHVGDVEITLDKEHKPSAVRYVVNETVYSWYANSSKMAGRILSEITNDTKRNLLCVDILKDLFENGRVILVLGDRVQHLHVLRNLCMLAGIPKAEMGMYVGEEYTPKMKKQAVEPRQIKGLKSGIDYCPIEIDFKKSKVKKAAIDDIKEKCSIIFATYKVFDKGVDLPELNAGLDVTPRAKAQQAHGRILRSEDGKVRPIWVTIRDINNFRLEHTFRNRVLEYDKSNGELSEWNLEKGVRKWDVQDLEKDISTNAAVLRRTRILNHREGGFVLSRTDSRPTPRAEKSTKRTRQRK